MNLIPPSRRGANSVQALWRTLPKILFLGGALGCFGPARIQAAPTPATNAVLLLSTNGTVEVLRAGARTWDFASVAPEKNVLHPGDQIRALANSSARVQLADRTIETIGPFGHLELLQKTESTTFVRLLRGLFFFLHRDEPGDVHVLTPTVAAVIRGTEFVVEVAPDGSTLLQLLDGAVEMTNALGRLDLQTGQAAQVLPGQPPQPTPILSTGTVVQWCLYYPAILNLDELPMSAAAQGPFADSFAAYRSGDLRAALARYPDGRTPETDAERIYLAALRLSVSQVAEAEALLQPLNERPPSTRPAQLAAALQRLIAAVRSPVTRPKSSTAESAAETNTPPLSTSWLAESYYRQAQGDLASARTAARRAVELAPEFAFAQARLAEVEFGHGQIERARRALVSVLSTAPRHAQAVSLRGFLLAAEHRLPQAIAAFDEALALDSGLGQAWLGRGLCRIRLGAPAEGRRDLEVAAATEPQRALFRSYLGKAFQQDGDAERAATELELARHMDPNDPTAWLYSALLRQSRNQINDSIRELERSQALNDNRSVYRSRLMLDEDRAVRSANLASVYRDAGLTDVAAREAARAAQDDYANFSAHLFLANSYNELRDPNQVNLRYDTPWFSEFLTANLLAPVGAGTLSQRVSDQEYARLFEQDRLGLASYTEYRSSGNWVESAAQFGTVQKFEYALEAYYRAGPGEPHRTNNDQRQLTLSVSLKQQITRQDTLFFRATYYDNKAGDLAQVYDPNTPSTVRYREKQEPILLAGYHHEWAPGLHTLLLGARLTDHLEVTNSAHGVPVPYYIDNVLNYVAVAPQGLDYDSRLEIYSVELQQIAERGSHRLIAGTRQQFGEFDTSNHMPGLGVIPPTDTSASSGFQRFNAYAYWHEHPVESLRLIAGVSYDWLFAPQNFRSPPINADEFQREQVSPKAGVIWTPIAGTTVRGAYTRSLGGVSLDQSVQLEPNQIAGFIQNYRSLIPESVAGQAAGARFDSWGLAVDQKFAHGTYIGLTGEWLLSDAKRRVGVFRGDETTIGPGAGTLDWTLPSMRETLDYRERSVTLALHQLIGREWTLGASHRFSQAELEDDFNGIPATGPTFFDGFQPRKNLEAILNQLRLYAVFNHPSGFFAGGESIWSVQHNDGYTPALADEDFWQFNLHAGYRFLRRRVEARISLLNITDRNYRLNPLNLTSELPRDRTLALSLAITF